jgi:hypothetical protein
MTTSNGKQISDARKLIRDKANETIAALKGKDAGKLNANEKDAIFLALLALLNITDANNIIK